MFVRVSFIEIFMTLNPDPSGVSLDVNTKARDIDTTTLNKNCSVGVN